MPATTAHQPNQQAAKPTLSLRRKVLFSAIVSCVFFGCIEAIARLAFPDTTGGRFRQIRELVLFLGTQESDLMLDYDPERFWTLRPNIRVSDPDNTYWQGTVSNSHGFRSPEFSIEKPIGTTRIACFGDSSTFGIGVRMEDTWPFQLEEQLKEAFEFSAQHVCSATARRRIQVINAGVPGYTSHQGLRHMQQELDRLQPDIVFASYANNDFWTWDNRTDAEHAIRLQSWSLRRMLLRSRAVQLLDEAVHSPQQPASQEWAASATNSYFIPNNDWTQRVPLDAFRANIESMADLCAERDIPLILVLWPDQSLAAGRWSIRLDFHDVLRDVAAQQNLGIADVTTVFRQNRPWSVQSYVANDIVHVNRYGNQLAAVAAFTALRQILRTDEKPLASSQY
ncbi:MAG: SGNH/GDSL hydrolase family protein [Planctomycetota bacterium]|jgi:lysophospholipase L1-like esterase